MRIWGFIALLCLTVAPVLCVEIDEDSVDGSSTVALESTTQAAVTDAVSTTAAASDGAVSTTVAAAATPAGATTVDGSITDGPVTTGTTTLGTTVTQGAPGTTTIGTTGVPATAGSTAAATTGQPPVAVTTNAPIPTTTVDPLVYDKFTMPNEMDVIDAKAVLQSALVLSNQVNSLTAQLTALQAQVDPANSPLIAELTVMNNNATAMNQTLQNLVSQLTVLNTTEATLEANYTSIAPFYQCFITSSCVTEMPTTGMPTTTAIPTTPVMTTCPTEKYSSADQVNYKLFHLDTSTNIDCQQSVSATGSATVDLIVATTIVGKASLAIINANTGATIQTFTSTTNTTIATNSSIVFVKYSTVGNGNSIQFDINYKASSPCDGFDCRNGTCSVTSNGNPYCVCFKCFGLDADQKCTISNDPCTSTAQRACGMKRTPANGQCKMDNDSPTCSYYCQCNVPAGDKPLSCPAPAGAQMEEVMFYQRWFY